MLVTTHAVLYRCIQPFLRTESAAKNRDNVNQWITSNGDYPAEVEATKPLH